MSYNPRHQMISRDELQQRMQASARNVFSVMADIALEECFEGPDELQTDWVTALLGFEGSYSGLVALHCPEPLARRITAGLLRVGEVAVHDVHDAMGEVVNILGGDMKLFLGSRGRGIQLSSPSVFAGYGEFYAEFLLVPETVTCTMAAGDERLLIGVQVSRGD
ncbi:MAG: chemotaxis protein CheX [Pelobacteraceae bacterium]